MNATTCTVCKRPRAPHAITAAGVCVLCAINTHGLDALDDDGRAALDATAAGPSDAELSAAIGRQDEHAKRLAQRAAALQRAGELLQEAALAALKLAPHLLAQIDDDPEGSARRIRDGVLRVFRSGQVF